MQGSQVVFIFDVDFNPGLSEEEIHQITVAMAGSLVKSRLETILPPPVDICSPRQENSDQEG